MIEIDEAASSHAQHAHTRHLDGMTSLLSLSALLGQSTITDHEQVLEAANVALNKSGKDIEAQHVKVVALLKLDRFDEALKTLDHGGDQLKEKARLEWAYALYKAGRPDRAAEVAKSVAGGDVSDRGMRHVEAQASYRIENFERAAQLFTQLAAGGRGVAHEDMDLRINNSAVNAQLEWSGKGDLVESKKPEREDLEAFETAYNAACGSIARGELGQAEVLLRRSKGAFRSRGCRCALYNINTSAQTCAMHSTIFRKRRSRPRYCPLLCSRSTS